VQYTIRNVPRQVDKALRQRAKDSGKSLNEVAVEALSSAVGANGNAKQPARHHDLDFLIGTWIEDPAFDQTIAEHDRVDPKDWR
jgi:plasmid stability protein